MNSTELHARLVNAVTTYDRQQSTKRHWNHYALPQYLARVAEVVADVENGATPRAAIMAGFNDRLRDHCLRAISEPVAGPERATAQWCYTPASGR